MAVTLPVVLLILDFYPLGRLDIKSAFTNPPLPPFSKGGRGGIKVFIEKIPFLSLSLASSVITIMAQQADGGIAPSDSIPIGARTWIAIRAPVFYLSKMFWPSGIVPLYSYSPKTSFMALEYIGALLLLIIITTFFIYSLKKQPLWLIVWTYYIVTLLPTLGIIQTGTQIAADRYAYLPSLGPFLIAGLCISYLWGKASNIGFKIFIIIPSMIILLSLSIITTTHISVWKDSITLWSYEIKRFPDNLTAYINRGHAYIKSALFQQAFEDSNMAIILNPKYASGYNNRGTVYMKTGRYQEALNDFNMAIMLDPFKAKIYNNRGLTYMETGDYQKAIADLNIAIILDYRYSEAYNNRGIIYRASGNYQKAIEEYNKAVSINPLFAKAYYNRGIVYGILGQYQQAIGDYTIALGLDPQLIRAYNNRGNVYLNLGNNRKAIEDFNMAIKLDPKDDKAYFNRAVVLRNLGSYEQAINDYKISLRSGLFLTPSPFWKK